MNKKYKVELEVEIEFDEDVDPGEIMEDALNDMFYGMEDIVQIKDVILADVKEK